jgi:hypothetical protein
MHDTLIIDADSAYAERLVRTLRLRKLRVDVVRDSTEAIVRLCHRALRYQLVIINVSDASQPWPVILGRLREACSYPGRCSRPLFLCVSRREREPEFELAIERSGARYVVER